EALGAYEGTLIAVSHDRYFLDQICTRLFVIDGRHVEAHAGNYSDWCQRTSSAGTLGGSPPPPATDSARQSRAPSTRSTPPSAPRAPEPASASTAARGAGKQRERE